MLKLRDSAPRFDFPAGSRDEAGGEVLKADSIDYRILQQFVRRAVEPKAELDAANARAD